MFTKKDLLKTIGVVITIILLTACAPQAVQTPATTAIPITGSTQAPATAAATLPSTAAQGSSFEGLSTGLDNTKLARIRTVSGVIGMNLDVFINGLPVVNGGKKLQNIDVGSFSGWIYVTPGTYQVALVPNGETVDKAIFNPVAVDAAAGHRYTVAAMGQQADKNVKPLVIDETALEASVGQKDTDGIWIWINDITGVDTLGVRHDGKMLGTAKSGGVFEAFWSSDKQEFEEVVVTVAGKPDAVIASGTFYGLVGQSQVTIAYGHYPDTSNIADDSQGTSEANVLDFLAESNSHPLYTDDGHLITFNTLLSAIDKAGIRDLFSKEEPYFFIAPTDEAFSALPKDQLDALLNDPQQLAKLLKTGFMTGYYPFGSLSGATYGTPDRVITNMLGQDLSFQGETINGLGGLGRNVTVGNGNRLQFVYNLLPVK
jgi:hypothetical protein